MAQTPGTGGNSTGPVMRGGVDLSGLAAAHAASAPAGAESRSAGAPVEAIEVTELGFQAFAERSLTVPVFLLLCSRLAPGCADLRSRVERIAADYPGRLVLGFADVDSEPGIAAAFQVTAVPAMLALIGGRPAPLFQGSPEDEQLRSVIEQVLQVAGEAGIGAPTAAGDAPAPEPPPLPPLHEEAYAAIENGDYAAAIAAYDKALKENPKDADARAGRAHVALLQRLESTDADSAHAALKADPLDLDAQLAVADLEVAAGDVEAALSRLLEAVRANAGDDRERVRVRLVELFEVVGIADERVIATRQALASALY